MEKGGRSKLKSRNQLNLDGFDVRVFLQAVQTQFLAKTRLLVTTKGSTLIEDIITNKSKIIIISIHELRPLVPATLSLDLPVHPDSTGFQAVRDNDTSIDVGSVHATSKAIF